jgi:hypothetical protein
MSQNVPPAKRTLLAAGTPVGAAAEQAGVSRRTVERCLARPAFRRLVARFRGDMLATALGRLTDNMTRAADAVAALLDAPEPHIRLRAAAGPHGLRPEVPRLGRRDRPLPRPGARTGCTA